MQLVCSWLSLSDQQALLWVIPCGNCALCGNFAAHCKKMVKNAKTVANSHGQIYALKQTET